MLHISKIVERRDGNFTPMRDALRRRTTLCAHEI